MISLESRAIIETTAPLVQTRRAGLLFQMWHDLGPSPAARLLFDTFTADGELVGLIEAIIVTATSPTAVVPPRFLLTGDGHDRASARDTVEPVLLAGLKTVLAEAATPMVLNAWRDAFRRLMRD